MKSPHIGSVRSQFVRLLAAGALVVLLLPVEPALAQRGVLGAPQPAPAQPPAPAQTVTPADTLGRDTPRGTLLGFMRAAREGKDEVAFHYLNTQLRGQAAIDLARQLYVVLDSRLPVRLSDVSDQPDGSRANPLRPDQDVVGTISTADGQLELTVERVSRGTSAPIWLFSRRTLDAIPDVYDEIDLISFDRYLPDAIGRPRLLGIRIFGWLTLLVLVPLSYRLMGMTRLPGALRLLVLSVAIRWLLGSVDLPLRERQFWNAIAALLMMIAGVWALLRANAYGERYIATRFRDSSLVEVGSLVRLGRRMADVLVVVAAGLVALSYFGVDPTAALAGLGIGGIAVALAAQKTLENVIGGLSLIFDRAVRVGDFLKLGDAVGTVDSIGLRSTRIRTLDRTLLSVPNGQIANASLETLSARDQCWFRHVLGLRYETSSAQLRRVMDEVRRLLATHPEVVTDSVRVRLFRFGASSLDIEMFAYVRTIDWSRFLEIQEQLLVGVMEIVEGAGTAIAFPTQTVHIAAQHAGEPAVAVPARQDSESGVSIVR